MSNLAEQLIAEEEGREPCAYPDTQGFMTIAIGCLVDKRVKGAGLCDAAIDAQFAHDSAQARADASALAGFVYANDIRQAVLISMCFQLGNLHDWPNFRKAVAVGDWEAAVTAGMDSAWYKTQTPERAKRELGMLASGQWIAK